MSKIKNPKPGNAIARKRTLAKRARARKIAGTKPVFSFRYLLSGNKSAEKIKLLHSIETSRNPSAFPFLVKLMLSKNGSPFVYLNCAKAMLSINPVPHKSLENFVLGIKDKSLLESFILVLKEKSGKKASGLLAKISRKGSTEYIRNLAKVV
jgi:hypothetical protein